MTADRAIKEPCRVATTANITLSGFPTIDGVTVAAGDRVLVKAQTTDSDNGIYVAASGAWAFATDFDALGEAVGGTQVLVTSGTLNAGSAWRIVGEGTAITPGATAIAFERAVDSDSVAFLQQGPGAEIRGVEGKLRDFIHVHDFHDAIDGADITVALVNAINSAAPGFDVIQIFIPEGDFVVKQQILATRPFTLRGAGMYATKLTFVELGEEIDAVFKGALSITDTASFSVIHDICIEIGEDPPSGLDYCIWTSGRLFATNVRLVSGGLKVRAGAAIIGGGSPVTGNANNCLFQNVVSSGAPEYGFFINGTDANACTIIGCTAIDMADIGFVDASFLGNTYLGCCADGGATATAVSAYQCWNVAGTNTSLFSGCYAESTFTGDVWDVDTGGLILQPHGVFPEPLTPIRNSAFAASAGAGLWANQPLTITPRQANAYPIGDATNSAAVFHANGLHIRDRNGNLAQFTAEAGGTMLLKANFPVYANNGAAAGAGLAVDSVYSTSTGELRVVV